MPRKRLPPDPERMNHNRADWALTAILAFQDETGTEDGDALSDLIADLGHLADRYPEFGSVADAIRRASGHYDAETSGRDLLK